MIRSVRSNAGLGFPPKAYTTNNESINRVLKDKVSYKKQEWPEFNLKMFELVKEQEEERLYVVVVNMNCLKSTSLWK